jgi:hypothetical protein
MFASLVDNTVDLETARNITSLLYRKKRAEFKDTSEMIENLLAKDADLVYGIGRETLPNIRDAWKRDEDFMAAYQEFIVKPAEQPWIGEPVAKVVNTRPQGMTTFPAEILSVMYSSCLTGIFAGAPLAVTMTFASFIRSLSLNTFGMACNALRGEGGYYHYLREILLSFMKCATVTVASALALFGAFKLVSRMSEQESGVTRTAKARGSQVRTYEESGISEGQQKMLMQATGSMLIVNSGKLTNCVFVGGHYVMVPYHLFTDYRGNVIADGEKVELTKVSWKDLTKTFLFDRKSVVRLTGNINEALARRGDVMPKDTYREDICLQASGFNV